MKISAEKIQMPPVKFALWALRSRFKTQRCPLCASTQYQHLGRKKVVVEAKKCSKCSIIFRWPVDDPGSPEQYQLDRQGFDEVLPNASEAKLLLDSNFKKSPYDFSYYLALFAETLPAPAKVLNFGASWGYMSVQMQKQGYEVFSLEITPDRYEFAKKNIPVPFYQNWKELAPALEAPLDGIFSNHLLCHASHPGKTFGLFYKALRPGGTLMMIVPNAEGPSAKKLGLAWGSYLGQTHPVAYSPQWFHENFKNFGFIAQKVFCLPENQDDIICIAKKI